MRMTTATRIEQVFDGLKEVVLAGKARHDRYEAALRRIVKDAPLIDAEKMYEIAREALRT